MAGLNGSFNRMSGNPIVVSERGGMGKLLERTALMLLVIFAAAVMVRAVAAWVLPYQSALLPDAAAFRAAAKTLANEGRITDIYRMPGYPLLILLVGAGTGQLIADILLSSFAACIVYLLSLEVFKDRAIAALAGLGAALYPPLIYFAVVGLSETLFLTLVMLAFYAWYRSQFALAALASVLAILTRPLFDLAAIFFVIYFSLVVHGGTWRWTLRNVVVYAVIYCALLAPWWLHNYRAYGTFARFDLALGTVLYAGNNPKNHTGGGNLVEDYDVGAFASIKDPVGREAVMRKAAVDFIVKNPKRFAELAVLKFVRLWRFWPHNEKYSDVKAVLASALGFVPVCIFSAIYLLGWGWRELRPISPLVLFIGYNTAACMVLFGTVRFRLPFEPYLIMFAAAGAVHLFRFAAVSRSRANTAVPG
jgi:hypothetical protein